MNPFQWRTIASYLIHQLNIQLFTVEPNLGLATLNEWL